MTSAPASDFHQFLNGFEETIQLNAERLREISDEQSAIARAEGKWLPREILGHLIDSAANNHQRFVRAQFTDELVVPPYEQEEWVAVQRYRERDWRELINLWQTYNQHILHIMRVTPEETRMKLRHKHNLHITASETLSENEPVTLDYFMRDYVDHMKKHLKQILGRLYKQERL